jgi:hypothetical protein
MTKKISDYQNAINNLRPDKHNLQSGLTATEVGPHEEQ